MGFLTRSEVIDRVSKCGDDDASVGASGVFAVDLVLLALDVEVELGASVVVLVFDLDSAFVSTFRVFEGFDSDLVGTVGVVVAGESVFVDERVILLFDCDTNVETEVLRFLGGMLIVLRACLNSYSSRETLDGLRVAMSLLPRWWYQLRPATSQPPKDDKLHRDCARVWRLNTIAQITASSSGKAWHLLC